MLALEEKVHYSMNLLKQDVVSCPDFVRFLWIDDIDKKNPKLIVKQFSSLLFDLNCATFILGVTIDLHVKKISSLNQGSVSQFYLIYTWMIILKENKMKGNLLNFLYFASLF